MHNTSLFNDIHRVSFFSFCTRCKTLRLSVFNKELLNYSNLKDIKIFLGRNSIYVRG